MIKRLRPQNVFEGSVTFLNDVDFSKDKEPNRHESTIYVMLGQLERLDKSNKYRQDLAELLD